MSKGFNLPAVFSVPVEKEMEINERVERDLTYAVMRDKKIRRQYLNLTTNVRRVGDFIYKRYLRIISYEEIKKMLGINVNSVKQAICDLNFWREYPLRMIPVPKKKGYIQSFLKDPNDTDKYLRRKSRAITSMEQVYENVEKGIKAKQRKKERILVKEHIKPKNN